MPTLYQKALFGISMKQSRPTENIWPIYKDFKHRYAMTLNMYNSFEAVNKLINEEHQTERQTGRNHSVVFELKRAL